MKFKNLQTQTTIKISFFLFLIIVSCTGNDNNNNSIEESQRNDNGVLLNIPLTGSLQNPAFSPDGNTILFTHFVNGYNVEPAELYMFNLKTEELTQLVADGSGNINLPGSSWLNNKIIFSSTQEPHDEIYTINVDGANQTKITERANKVAFEPTFSPDGLWTVFETHILDVEGNGVITKYMLDGTSEYIALTAESEDNRQPNWSPNNNKILYQQFRNNQWNLWTMDIDGANKTQITTLGNNTDASFSADGQFIVYSSDNETDIANIYRISVNGGSPIRVSDYTGYDGAVSIAADGTKIAFESINGEPDNSSGTKIILLNL